MTRIFRAIVALTFALIINHSVSAEDKPSTWSWSTPQAKINYVDTSQAPKVKVYVSFLNEYLKPVPKGEGGVSKMTLFRKGKKGRAEPLFSIRSEDDEVTYPDRKEGVENPINEEEAPAYTLLLEEDQGMAMMVIMPGTAPAYRNEGAGSVLKSTVNDFLKAGKNHRVNLLWVGTSSSGPGRVLMHLEGPNLDCTLCDAHKAKPTCDKAALERLEKHGEPPSEGDDKKAKPLNCGLTFGGAIIGKAIKDRPFQGFCPNLFGLGALPLSKKCTSTRSLSEGDDDDKASKGSVKPALQLALETLVKEAKPGEPRAIVLLGDGRDGYFYRVDDERSKAVEVCTKDLQKKRGESWNTLRKKRKECVKKRVRKMVASEQARFVALVEGWMGLAKAGNIRIYAVANQVARPDEQDRLSVLALRTGGTYRYAEDESAFQEMMEDLTTEVNQQYVFTFTDKEAVEGASYNYEVELGYEDSEGTFTRIRTRSYSVKIPKKPTGLGVMISDARSGIQEKLGKTGMMALLIGLALVLALIVFALLKKLVGGKAKSAAGAAKKGKKAMKGLKGAAAQYKKIKK